LPQSAAAWALLTCRVAGIAFIGQALLVLALYAWRGLDTPPDGLPLGLRIDPLHAMLHLGLGLVAATAGFARPALAVPVTRLLALVYLALAFLGAFTPLHLGLELAAPENQFHLTVGTLFALVGFGPALWQRLGHPA
jgi:hypothetical protein